MKKSMLLMLLLSTFLTGTVLAGEENATKDENGAKKESTIDRIGEGVKKGGEAAGRGIEKGAKATVKGVKKAETWVGKKLQIGGEKIEKAGK